MGSNEILALQKEKRNIDTTDSMLQPEWPTGRNFRWDTRVLRLLLFARNDPRMIHTVIARSVSDEAIFCSISQRIADRLDVFSIQPVRKAASGSGNRIPPVGTKQGLRRGYCDRSPGIARCAHGNPGLSGNWILNIVGIDEWLLTI